MLRSHVDYRYNKSRIYSRTSIVFIQWLWIHFFYITTGNNGQVRTSRRMQLPWWSWGSCCIWKCVEAVIVWIKWRLAITACNFSDSGTASAHTCSTILPWRGMFYVSFFVSFFRIGYLIVTVIRRDCIEFVTVKYGNHLSFKNFMIWVVDASCMTLNLAPKIVGLYRISWEYLRVADRRKLFLKGSCTFKYIKEWHIFIFKGRHSWKIDGIWTSLKEGSVVHPIPYHCIMLMSDDN